MQLNMAGFKFVSLLATTTFLTTIGTLMFNHTSFAQTDRQVTLPLVDITKYYKNLPHQNRAIQLLQRQMDAINPSPLQVDSIFSNVWRNPNNFSGHIDILNQIPLADRTGADPLALAMRYAKWEGDGSRPTKIELLSGPENQVIVTVDLGNLQDDSTSGIRHRIDTKRKSNGQWEITKAGRQFLCHRGHSGGESGWAASLCI